MKNKYIYIVLVFIVLLFLGGCQPAAMLANTQSLPPRFNRFIDEEAGVVCWCTKLG
jgi:hypothetical protein